MTYRFVTSFSPEGYNLYGKVFLDKWIKYRIPFPLTIYYEPGSEIGPRRDLWCWRNLFHDPDCVAFLEANQDDTTDYRYQVNRFCRKVFAITNSENRDCDWLIWIDADTVLQRPFGEKFLRSVCPDDCSGSYLGRTEWHHSECGFVAYNLRQGAGEFLDRFRDVYVSGCIFDYLEWHDSYVFDRVRDIFPKMKFHNLSPEAKGLDAWSASPLSKIMVHHKGIKAKREAYGKAA